MKGYPLYTTECIRDLKELTDTSVNRYADRDAFRFMTDKTHFESITYRQFGADLAALAGALIDAGAGGARIALIGENSYFWVLSYFAIVNINATAVPLDKELAIEEILSLLKRSDATLFFHSNSYNDEAHRAAEVIPGLRTVPFDDGGESVFSVTALLQRGRALAADGVDHYSDIRIDRERTCSILFTSGTTGQSKGVMLNHRNITADVVAACSLVLYTEDDVMLSVLPLHHVYEAVAGVFCPLLRGATIAFCSATKLLPACMKLFAPTVMVLVPLYLETFIKRIWDNAAKQGKTGKLKFGIVLGNILAAVRIDIRRRCLPISLLFFGGRLATIVSGGAYLNPALVREFREFGIMVLQGYGTTECAPIVSVSRRRNDKDKSVGSVLPCCSVRIDAKGQILVRGSNVMKGYLDNQAATDDVIIDGWRPDRRSWACRQGRLSVCDGPHG